MAKQDIIISIQLKGAEGASKSTDQLSSATKKLSDLQRQEAIEVAKVNEQIKIQKDINIAAAKSSLGLASATGKTAAQMKASRAQSGLNNAILLETGRLASDASYGFTAIANNLSQVVSLFSSFTKTAGGLGASLKQLAGSLMGTGGLLIALQLIISFGPQIFDFFAKLLGATRELRDAMKGAADTIKQQAGSFEIYTRTLQDGWKSSEEMADATKMLKKEFPEYIKLLKDAELSLEDLKDGNEEAIAITKEYTKQIRIQAMARQAAIKIEEEASKIVQVQVDREVKAREEGFVSVKDVMERQKLEEESLAELTKKREEQDGKLSKKDTVNERKTKNALKYYKSITQLNQDEIEDAEKTIDILMEFTDIQTKDRKKGFGNRERDFKQHLLNLAKLQETYRQKAIDNDLKTREELIDQEEENAKAELDLRLTSFIEKQKLRLKEFKESKASDEEKKQAQIDYNESIELAFAEHTETMIGLQDAFLTKRNQLTRIKNGEAMAEDTKLKQLARESLDAQAALMDEESGIVGEHAFFEKQRNIDRMKSDEERIKGNIAREEEGSVRKAEAEIALFELQKNLSQEEQALQESKFGYIMEMYQQVYGALDQTFKVSAENQTIELDEQYSKRIEAAEGNADEQERLEKELAVKKDKIARKAFNIDKAMRISQALMTVYQNGFLAYGSQLFPGDVLSPVRAGIQQGITIAAGLANVANIARQKYQSSVTGGSGGTGGSAGGGGMEIKAPDFNVVGASQTSQLAESVAGQQAKPVKAFVVGKDISSQQELDRNITNTASFG